MSRRDVRHGRSGRVTRSLVIGAAVWAAGCGSETASPDPAPADDAPSGASLQEILQAVEATDAKPPYILQMGCTFALVTAEGVVSADSQRGSGLSGNATLNWGGEQMQLSECEVVGNPANLPVVQAGG